MHAKTHGSFPRRIGRCIIRMFKRPSVYVSLILLNVGLLVYHLTVLTQVFGRPPHSGYQPMNTIETPVILLSQPEPEGEIRMEATSQFSSSKRYRLTLPPSCATADEHAVRCIYSGGEFLIYPYGWSQTVDVMKRDTRILAGQRWNRVLYRNTTGVAASYGIDLREIYYLFEIRYAPYTPSAETMAEQIISTFHVIEP